MSEGARAGGRRTASGAASDSAGRRRALCPPPAWRAGVGTEARQHRRSFSRLRPLDRARGVLRRDAAACAGEGSEGRGAIAASPSPPPPLSARGLALLARSPVRARKRAIQQLWAVSGPPEWAAEASKSCAWGRAAGGGEERRGEGVVAAPSSSTRACGDQPQTAEGRARGYFAVAWADAAQRLVTGAPGGLDRRAGRGEERLRPGSVFWTLGRHTRPRGKREQGRSHLLGDQEKGGRRGTNGRGFAFERGRGREGGARGMVLSSRRRRAPLPPLPPLPLSPLPHPSSLAAQRSIIMRVSSCFILYPNYAALRPRAGDAAQPPRRAVRRGARAEGPRPPPPVLRSVPPSRRLSFCRRRRHHHAQGPNARQSSPQKPGAAGEAGRATLCCASSESAASST